MQEKIQSNIHSKISSHKSTYYIEYQPQLIEEAVLRAISGHLEEAIFRKERDRLYESHDNETRETAFHELHQNWFNRLELESPLRQILETWPILVTSTHRCILTMAPSKKHEGTELYVSQKETCLSERERRCIIVRLSPELLSHSHQLLNFLRHEFLHIVDMLDPNFGYAPELPRATTGPTIDIFLQQRYTVLWDITIDGRLYKEGWVSPSAREKHLTIFKQMFPMPESESKRIFSRFFDHAAHTHNDLISFVQNPEKWDVENNGPNSKGRCSICHFPSFDLITNSAEVLPAELIAKIQTEHPNWEAKDVICRQCMDLYELQSFPLVQKK